MRKKGRRLGKSSCKISDVQAPTSPEFENTGIIALTTASNLSEVDVIHPFTVDDTSKSEYCLKNVPMSYDSSVINHELDIPHHVSVVDSSIQEGNTESALKSDSNLNNQNQSANPSLSPIHTSCSASTFPCTYEKGKIFVVDFNSNESPSDFISNTTSLQPNSSSLHLQSDEMSVRSIDMISENVHEKIHETNKANSNQNNHNGPSESLFDHNIDVDYETYQSDNLLLHKQIENLTYKLLKTQNQVDQLLEEKRKWLENTNRNSNPKSTANQVVSGELRGRLVQAQNLAETYKRERENVVIKYAQSEQKRLQLENKIHCLECKLAKIINVTNQNAFKLEENQKKKDKHEKSDEMKNSNLEQIDNDSEKNNKPISEVEKDSKKSSGKTNHFFGKQNTEESRIKALELKLTQTQECLKTEQKKVAMQNDQIIRLNKSLEVTSKQAKEAERLREREAERLCTEVVLHETQENLKQLKDENEKLKENLEKFKSMKTDLENYKLRINELNTDLATVNDLRIELEKSKQRENELSKFTCRLTEQVTNLQTEHLITLNCLENYEKHSVSIQNKYQNDNDSNNNNNNNNNKIIIDKHLLNDQTNNCTNNKNEIQLLLDQIKQFESDIERLSDQVNRSRDSENKLKIQLQDERERLNTIHKRDLARIRNMAREISRLSHGKSINSDDPETQGDLDTETDSIMKLSFNSQTGSVNSLGQSKVCETIETGVQVEINLDMEQIDSCNNVSRDGLIAKIASLQKTQQQLTEKIEFLQNHCYQLTEELNKKGKVMQHLFMMSEKQTDDPTTDNLESHKNRSNRKTTSLISSFYSGRVTSKTLDLDLCLKINEKLQNLLEDSTFKNITLKENLSTLGMEIMNLTNLNNQLMNIMCETCKLTCENVQKSSIKINKLPLGLTNHSDIKYLTEPPVFKDGGMNA